MDAINKLRTTEQILDRVLAKMPGAGAPSGGGSESAAPVRSSDVEVIKEELRRLRSMVESPDPLFSEAGF